MPVEIELAIEPVLITDVPLPRRATFYPLGFPVEISTNSEAVLAAARESWGNFREEYSAAPIKVSITVTDDADDELPPRPRFRAHGHLMSVVGDPRNQMICDFNTGTAVGWVTRQMAAKTPALRLHYLEPAAMLLLVTIYMAPLHSALVTKNGVGLALCGESFAGKSTLAYACARSGWTLVSDDGTFLIRDREGHFAVGNPYSVRFREDAKELFPELAKYRIKVRPNGGAGMEVRTQELPMSTATGCSIDHLVFLRRSGFGPASMNKLAPEKALAWLEKTAFYGPAEAQAAQRHAYRRLLDAGLWELHYSDLSDALRLLGQLGAKA